MLTVYVSIFIDTNKLAEVGKRNTVFYLAIVCRVLLPLPHNSLLYEIFTVRPLDLYYCYITNQT